jgi:hypothetical protein
VRSCHAIKSADPKPLIGTPPKLKPASGSTVNGHGPGITMCWTVTTPEGPMPM